MLIKNKQCYGFSLIELMIVIAIISILAAIALPTYDGYTKKARFTELLIATQPYQLAVTLALQNGAALQDLTNDKFGIPSAHAATKNIKTITVANGVITAEASSLIDGLTYILKPSAGGAEWHVQGTCVKAGFCES